MKTWPRSPKADLASPKARGRKRNRQAWLATRGRGGIRLLPQDKREAVRGDSAAERNRRCDLATISFLHRGCAVAAPVCRHPRDRAAAADPDHATSQAGKRFVAGPRAAVLRTERRPRGLWGFYTIDHAPLSKSYAAEAILPVNDATSHRQSIIRPPANEKDTVDEATPLRSARWSPKRRPVLASKNELEQVMSWLPLRSPPATE